MEKKYIPGEEWRDIGGYENMYQISNLGNIRRVTTKAGNLKPHSLKLTKIHSGMRAFLCKDNHTIGYMVDRLVALAFVQNLQNKEFVYHLDGDICNNSANNLIWVNESDAVELCMTTCTEGEQWRDIPELKGLYQVSSYGRVRSLPRVIKNYNDDTFLLPSTIIKQQKSKDGYLAVCLYCNGIRKNYSVHRLVALAFISNPLNLSEVNHKDEIKTHNVPSNLEWCTKAYNTRYGTRTFRTSKPVDMYDLKGNYVKTFLSIRKASEETGIPTANIRNCAKGSILKDSKGNEYKVKTAGGYQWKFADKEKLQHLLFGLGIESNMIV